MSNKKEKKEYVKGIWNKFKHFVLSFFLNKRMISLWHPWKTKAQGSNNRKVNHAINKAKGVTEHHKFNCDHCKQSICRIYQMRFRKQTKITVYYQLFPNDQSTNQICAAESSSNQVCNKFQQPLPRAGNAHKETEQGKKNQ